MFCFRTIIKLVTVALALSFVICPNRFHATAAGTSLGEQSDHQVGTQVVDVVTKPQQVFDPYWTTEKGFATTIYIRNVHIDQSIKATVSLILPRRTIALPQTHIGPLQTVSIEVGKALLDRGEKLGQTGGAVIDLMPNLRVRSPLLHT